MYNGVLAAAQGRQIVVLRGPRRGAARDARGAAGAGVALAEEPRVRQRQLEQARGIAAQEQVEVVLGRVQGGHLAEAPPPDVDLVPYHPLLAKLDGVGGRLIARLVRKWNTGTPVGATEELFRSDVRIAERLA